MFKKISVLLLAIALMLSVPACSMPDAIFSDDVRSGEENEGLSGTADIYGFKFTLGEYELQLPINYGALSVRGWKISERVLTVSSSVSSNFTSLMEASSPVDLSVLST